MKRKAVLTKRDDLSKVTHLFGQGRSRAGFEMRQQVVMALHLKTKNHSCENENGDGIDRYLIATGIGVRE